jgi:demethylmenaquinone methyltransferase / 2-methoxy-6-polyprenyl-1,4-benzoquinol methylase
MSVLSLCASTEWTFVILGHVLGQRVDGAVSRSHSPCERGAADLAERQFEPRRGGADPIQVLDARHARRGSQGFLKRSCRRLGLIDAFRVFADTEIGELAPQLLDVAASRAFLRQLAHADDGNRVLDERSIGHRLPFRVEREPREVLLATVRAQVEPQTCRRLSGDDRGQFLTGVDERLGSGGRGAQVLPEAHRRNNTDVMPARTERNRLATRLFAPIASTYDRYAALLSFGQDPLWRRFLVSRVAAAPGETIVDVATGTAAVAIGLARRYGCDVVGIDQSPEMLAEGRRRVERARLSGRIDLVQGRAEAMPFPDGRFHGLTVTYLLRYVDDPAATLRELARVVRPGGAMASLEFFVPQRQPTRALWDWYVDTGLPLLGKAVSPRWEEVGRFLGPSIRSFYERYSLARVLELWRAAGVRDVAARSLTLGGGVVIWGTRGES